MPDTKRKVHEVVIKIHTNRAITASQAQRATWNALHNYDIYGRDDHGEPFATGHINVRKTISKDKPNG